jgi:3-hydroxyacyl-CoA dehydrogenase
VLKAVREGLSASTGDDFTVPVWVDELVARGALGEKSGAGYYKRDGDMIFALDWKTGEYHPRAKPEIPGVAELERKPLEERLRGILDLPGKYGDFARGLSAGIWHYALEKGPEIAQDLVSVDRALEWGFGWEMGPFRQVDAVGIHRVREIFSGAGLSEAGLLSLPDRPSPELHQPDAQQGFYRDGGTKYLAFADGAIQSAPFPTRLTVASLRQAGRIVEENPEAGLYDAEDGVLILGFRSKMGTLTDKVMGLLQASLDRIAREGLAGLVITHDDLRAFSAGANLKLVLAAANDEKWDEVEAMVRGFQSATMAIRHAPFPVVVAPFGLTLGGGAEITLHAGQVQAHGELYMGLVEAGVGLIPAGGGTKELLFRFTEELAGYPEADPFEAVRRAFDLIAVARMSPSAVDAVEAGLLPPGSRITMQRDRLLMDARNQVVALAGCWSPPSRTTIQALGRKALGNLRYGISAMREAGHITDHEVLIAGKLAHILCGGDGDPRMVTEQDILDLEREAFLSLLGTAKTRERIRYTLETGKTLRN